MKKFIFCIFFIIILFVLMADFDANSFARTEGETPVTQGTNTGEVKSEGLPVKLGEQELFLIRDVEGLSTHERANVISERLKFIAEDLNTPINSIIVSDYKNPLSLVMAGDKFLLAVLDEDVKPEGKPRHELANEYAKTLRAAIEKYRKDYSRQVIIRSSLLILLATLILISFLFIINRIRRKLDEKLSTWLEAKKVSIHVQKFEIIQTGKISFFATTLINAMCFTVVLVLIYSYVHFSLSILPWTQRFADRLLAYILSPLIPVARAIWMEIPDLVVVVIIIVLTKYLLKIIRLYFRQIETQRIKLKNFYPEWAEPTYKVCRLLVLFFAVVIAYPYIPGSQSQAFKGVSIFFGVLISLGSTGAVSNILAGYMIIYRQVFKIGDRVKIADYVGDVVAQRLQVVHLRTIKNEDITVPCSVIVNSHVINYSTLAKEKGLILHTSVTIGYDTPWRQVEALLLLAAERAPGLLRQPPPFVLQTSLDDFYVSYELNAYTDKPQAMAQTYTDLHRNIQDAFNEYGVQIMSPSYRGDPEQPKVVPKEQWYAPPARSPG
ncbi:MAG: mechanosensitive ion channel [Syntrophaceae bacterium]|nr:mechanosensitive ion channel [Syntrophaceae bacterium]